MVFYQIFSKSLKAESFLFINYAKIIDFLTLLIPCELIDHLIEHIDRRDHRLFFYMYLYRK